MASSPVKPGIVLRDCVGFVSLWGGPGRWHSDALQSRGRDFGILSRRRSRAAWLPAISTLGSSVALAGHPMMTEDAGTQGTGNFELELGYDWSRQE